MASKAIRWIIELDYNADPGLDPLHIRKSLAEEISNAKGRPVLNDNYIIFDRLDDAFGVRMRFSDNVVGVHKAVA